MKQLRCDILSPFKVCLRESTKSILSLFGCARMYEIIESVCEFWTLDIEPTKCI